MKFSILFFFRLGLLFVFQLIEKIIRFVFLFFRNKNKHNRIWNIDGAVARKIAILWAFFMYIGQATKDILEMPRPSPPAIQLEKRYSIN